MNLKDENINENINEETYDAAVTEEAADKSEAEVPKSFDASLDSFTYDDTCAEMAPPSKKFDFIRLAVLIICIGVCAYSSLFLVDNIYEKHKSDQIYNDILNQIDIPVIGVENEGDGVISLLSTDKMTPATPTMDEIIKNGATTIVTPGQYSAELAKVRASLEQLRNINDEIYGYIMVPNTNISYPVAQTDNDVYYLDHAYNGEGLVNGSIFADSRCHDYVPYNYNTILYGHNVTSGSMFNHINKFFEKDFFDSTLIYLYTFDGIFVFKPFSIHETEYDSGYIATDFAIPEHFVAFAEKLRDMSDVKSDMEFDLDSKIITMSTCTNGIHTRRYALHAKLVEVITD